MRNASWVVMLVVGCGGSSPTPQTTPVSNQTTQQPPTTPPAPTGLTKEVCAQRGEEFGPVPLREDQVALRRGTGVKTFADLASSKDAPIEVCMPDGEHDWIKSVTCAGGATPSSSARSGSVGPGGVCGSIVDLYIVKCPEKEYEVFMDMYMCPPGLGIKPPT